MTIALSVPVLAGDGDKAQDKPKENRICRVERTTGSLINQRRICMTKAQWDQLAAETKSQLEDMQRNLGQLSPASKDPFAANMGSNPVTR
jgi:hypothetical protein